MIVSVEAANKAWSWRTGAISKIHGTSRFGNLLVESENGDIWRICPEELAAKKLGPATELPGIERDADFVVDWNMEDLVRACEDLLGPQPRDRFIGFKQFPALGGAYHAENLMYVEPGQWIGFSGEVARQVDQLPDGTQVGLKWTD